MNMRFIAMISSIAVLVSATSSPGTDTSTSTVSGNGVNTFSAAPSSSQTTIKSTTLPSTSTSHKTSSSLLTQSPQISSSTQPTVTSTISTTVNITTTNNITNTSNIHIPNTNSPSQQPDGSEEQTTQVHSVTTAPVYVPVVTIQKTTDFPCDCSKYLTTSTASVSNQTETKTTQPISASTVSITSAFTTTTSPKLSTNSTTSATMSSKTSASTLTNTTTTSTITIPTTTTTTISTTASSTIPTTTATTIPTTTATTISTTTATTIPTTTSSTTPTTTTTTIPTTTSSTTPTTTTTTIPTTTTTTIPTTTSSTTPTTTTTTIPTTTSSTTPTTTTTKIPTTTSSTIPSTTSTTEPTKTLATTPSQAQTTHMQNISKNRRRRGVVNTKVQSEYISFVDDVTSEYDHCLEACNITMNDTTAVPPLSTTTERPTTTTAKPMTTTPRHRSIDLSGKSVVLQLVIVVNDTFTSDMEKKNSTVYKNLVKQYKPPLTEFYSSLLPTKKSKIVILGFSSGSIKCNYTLEMDVPINKTDATSTLLKLRELSWNNASLTNLTLDVKKTAAEQAVLLSNDSVFLPANICVNNEVLEWDNDGNPICKYKCDIPLYKSKCGDHGECSFTYGGTFRCICKDGYSGELCNTPTTTAKPIKPDAIALSKIDIIGIAGGIGGGLVLILLVALCCVYTKLNKAKKRDRFYGYMDNDKEFLHDENSRIENVPDLKNEYTNLGYQTEQDELQMQRFEPEGKNVDYEPGQRQGAYERDDKSYRKVEEPEGGNVLIYQPKHLNGPMERQSGASKFDEVEERSNPYRMMDTDTTYKIRRPTVNSDRNVPYN